MLLSSMLKKLKGMMVIVALLGGLIMIMPATASAATPCGSGDNRYTPTIDLGCKGKGDSMTDLLFAIIRFLSYGVGLVITASLVYAGIQYTGSRGDPNANALAVKRIQANVVALFIFIFAFAMVNYVVPGAFLK